MRPHALVALTLLLPVAVPAPASGDSPDLQCGGLAPAQVACEACCVRLGDEFTVGLGVLLYTGGLEVEVRGNDGSWLVRCWALAAGEVPPTPVTPGTDTPLSECEGPFEKGDTPRQGDLVSLRCKATSTKGPHLPLPRSLGPWGPWGCSLDT